MACRICLVPCVGDWCSDTCREADARLRAMEQVMRPAQPLPQDPPFITFYTPTFMRPQGLAKCMASVAKQTAVKHVEQIVLPDLVGYGVASGLYGRIPWYAEACRGKYVHILCDDDELMTEKVVAQLMAFAYRAGDPPVIVVGAIKKGFAYPSCDPSDPQVSQVDLGCYVLRRDIWLAHARDYGLRYEGDFDHAVALKRAGVPVVFCDIDFVEGGASNGRPEVEWK